MPRGGLAPQINPGEGAFYGPKLEFALRDRLGRNRRGDTYKAKRQHISRQSANIYSSAYHLASARIGRGIG
jgi:threonyl-tRNA synthetase